MNFGHLAPRDPPRSTSHHNSSRGDGVGHNDSRQQQFSVGSRGGDKASSIALTMELLEVITHAILYTRQVYPAAIFERRKKYGIPVWMSRHPALNRYIRVAVESVENLLVQGALEKFIVSVKNKNCTENFVFGCEFQPLFFGEMPANQQVEAFTKIKDYFQSALLKVLVMDSSFKPIIKDSSFEIVINLTQDLSVLNQRPDGAYEGFLRDSVNPSQAWTPFDDLPSKIPGIEAEIVPIKSTNSDLINLEMYLEVN